MQSSAKSYQTPDPFFHQYINRPMSSPRLPLLSFIYRISGQESYPKTNAPKLRHAFTRNLLSRSLRWHEESTVHCSKAVSRSEAIMHDTYFKIPVKKCCWWSFTAVCCICFSITRPFFRVDLLLDGLCLTDRLEQLRQLTAQYEALSDYVQIFHDLSSGISSSFSIPEPSNTAFPISAEHNCNNKDNSDSDESGDSDTLHNYNLNPQEGLPPTIAAEVNLDSLAVQNTWERQSTVPSQTELQEKEYKSYLADCTNMGVHRANQKRSTLSGVHVTNSMSLEHASNTLLICIKWSKSELNFFRREGLRKRRIGSSLLLDIYKYTMSKK